MNLLAKSEAEVPLLTFKAAPVRFEPARRRELEVVASPRDWVRTEDKTLRLKACRLRLFMKLIFSRDVERCAVMV